MTTSKRSSPHVVHSTLPVPPTAFPWTQSEQSSAPAAWAYVPGWQSVHGSPTVELLPARHVAHAKTFASIDSRPAGQAAHLSPPRLMPRPSASSERRVTYEPAAHESHCDVPSEPLKVPIGHGRHWSLATAPGSAR